MSGSQVTVLCPNGRRAVVKTKPGLSILQVIENACEKQSLNPDLYDIKLLRRKLDPSSTIRFSNVPNNAQLELVTAASPRQANPVKISLAIECGQRLVAEFASTATFMDVLKHHEEKGSLVLPAAESGMMPVVVYTMERLSGERLHSTTLKSLGIVKGSYMLRYLVQNVESSKGSLQLHGSGSLTRPKAAQAEEPNSNVDMDCALPDSSTEASPSLNMPQQPAPLPMRQAQDPVCNLDIVKSANMSDIPDVLCSDKIQSPPDVLKLSHEAPTPPSDFTRSMDLVSNHSSSLKPKSSECCEHVDLTEGAVALDQASSSDEIIPLGSHNSLLFSLDDAPSTVTSDEDDSFFELSVGEVQRLYREQLHLLKEMEDTPLRTEKLRSLEEEGKLLSAMRDHPVTHLRIIFPDRLVIQATFKPHDTITIVKDFLRQFLLHPQENFYLYSSYPKKLLDPLSTLVECDCIPNSRLYYASDTASDQYISEEVLSKKSSFSAANKALKRNRTARMPQSLGATGSSNFQIRNASSSVPPSSDANNSNQDFKSSPRVSTNQKTPKWFKLSK